MKKKFFTLALAAWMAAVSIAPPAPVIVQAADTGLTEQAEDLTGPEDDLTPGQTDDPTDHLISGQIEDPTDHLTPAQQTEPQEGLSDTGAEDPDREHTGDLLTEPASVSADSDPKEQTAGEPQALEDSAYIGQGWTIYYTEKDDGTLEIRSAWPISSPSDPLMIPEAIDGRPVTSIRSSAFSGSSMERAELPDSITSIGEYAFKKCTSLTSVRLPAHLTQIGRYIFSECAALTGISIPESVTSIEENAFYACGSLTSIGLPEGLTSVGSSAFYGCKSLRELILPDSLTHIGWHAFANCSDLKKIVFPRTIATIPLGVFAECTGLTSITIPDTVTTLEENAFGGCSGLKSIAFPSRLAGQIESAFGITYETAADGGLTLKNSRYWVLPATINGKKITRIGNRAFLNRGIESAVVPEGVTAIGAQAFQNCFSLKEIKLPSTLKTLGERAFKDCQALTAVSVPEGVSSIEPLAFNRCFSLASVSLPKSVTSIRESAFYSCRVLKDITVPQNVKTIEKHAFGDCGELISITLPAVLTTITDDAFTDCPRLKDVYFQGSRTQWRKISIGSGNTALTNATIHYAVSDASGDTCRVTFDTAGIGTAIPAQNVREGGLATRPTTVPGRTGYTFTGWYQGNKQWNFNSDKITRDTVLTARWTDAEATHTSHGTLYESNFDRPGGRKIIPVGATITLGHSSLYDEVVFHHASWAFPDPAILDRVENNNAQCKARAYAVGTTSVTTTTKFQGVLPGTSGLFLDQDDVTVEYFRVADYISSLKLPASMNLKTGQSAPIGITTVPAGNYSRAVSGFTLTSSDPNIVTIRSDNIATGAGKGTATITATAKNRSGAVLRATCRVTVGTTVTPTKTPTPAPSVCRHSRSNKKIVSVTKQASYLEDGKRVLQCKICGKKTTETVPGYDRVEMYCDGKYYDEADDDYICDYEYTGKVIRPTIRVLDRKGKTLKQGTDYSLTYPKNAKTPGYYTVTVTFKGSYCLTYKPHFWISPKEPQITSLKAKKGGFTLKWKKPAYATGYEIRYSTSPKFTKKTTRTVRINGSSTKSRTVLRLARNKKYYIDIRCYRKIKSYTVYSYYTATQTVRTK